MSRDNPERETRTIVTCEHGGSRVPARWRSLFDGREEVLSGHRAYDRGSLPLARALARALDAQLYYGTVTRLLVDLNRSPRNPRRFSEFTRGIPLAEREEMEARHYRPYREAVMRAVDDALDSGARVVHVSVHAFTPVLDKKRQNVDIGLLYDPGRQAERALVAKIGTAIRAEDSDLRIRRNHPFRGVADGMATFLRGLHADPLYAGIELEVSEGLLTPRGRFPDRLIRVLTDSISLALVA